MKGLTKKRKSTPDDGFNQEARYVGYFKGFTQTTRYNAYSVSLGGTIHYDEARSRYYGSSSEVNFTNGTTHSGYGMIESCYAYWNTSAAQYDATTVKTRDDIKKMCTNRAGSITPYFSMFYQHIGYLDTDEASTDVYLRITVKGKDYWAVACLAGGYDKAVDKESFIDYLWLLHNIPLNEKIDEVFWQMPPPENYVKNKVPTERLW